jgi:high-affinity nickel-transport protein
MGLYARLRTHDMFKTVLVLIALHVTAWGLLVTNAVPGSGITLATGLTAYLLGLRHAFDADHITAIDNTTRKLMADGKKAHNVGFFFALGHSTVVITATALLALGVQWIGSEITNQTSVLHTVGNMIGGLVSGGFLVVVAVLNTVVLVALIRALKNVRSGKAGDEDVAHVLDTRGAIARLLRPVNRVIDKPWKMYPLGLLFGLGFDTASSVALMVMSSVSVLAGNSLLAAVSVPLIFTAGMALGDSVDGALMVRAYRWSGSVPVRRAQYNVAVTSLSIVAALMIGVPTLASVAVDSFGWHTPALDWLGGISFENIGFVLAAMFMSFWGVSAFVSRRQA